MADPGITANIGSLDPLPSAAFLDTDVLEIERVREDPEPNDNYHVTWGGLKAAIAAAIGSGTQTGDTLITARDPGAGWLAQGAIYAQSAYPAAFALLGTIPDGPPGAVWESVSGGTGRAVNAYGQLGESDTIIGVGANVVWRSLDRARTWESITTSLTLTVIDVLPSGAYAAGTGTNAPFVRSTDNGATWAAMTKPTGVSTTIAPVGFRQSGTRLFVFYLANNAVFYSDNNGTSWAQCSLATAISPQQLIAHGANTLTICASNTTNNQRSTDNGVTFVTATVFPSQGPTSGSAYYVNSATGVTVMMGNNVVMRSTDRGASWTTVISTGFTSPIGALGVSGRLIAFSVTAIFYSDNEGQTWVSTGTAAANNGPRTYIGATEVVLQPAAAASAYQRSSFVYSYDRLTQFKTPAISGLGTGLKGYIKS